MAFADEKEHYPELQKVVDDYYSEVEQIRENYKRETKNLNEKAKSEKLKSARQKAQEIQKNYKDKLKEKYENKQQDIKSRVGFGEDDPSQTKTELSFAESLDKVEIKTLVDRYQENNNYIGLKKIKPIAADKGLAVDFKGVSDELDILKKTYKGKQSRFNDNPLNDSEEVRLEKLFGIK